MKNKSFKFFESYHLALSKVSDKQYARIVRAICQYVFEGITPNFTNGTESTIWELMKPIIEKGCQLSEVRSEAGKQGGDNGKGVSRNAGNAHAAKNQKQIKSKSKANQKQINSGEGIGEGIGIMDKEMELSDSSISFDDFWSLYDMKISRSKCEKLWRSMTDAERVACMEYIPKYKQATPDKTFRKHPETFLRNKCWEDEIIYPKAKTESLPIGMRLNDNEQLKYNETW